MHKLRTILLLMLVFLGFFASLYAQHPGPKITPNDPNLPKWVQLMYAEKPNALEVEKAFEEYYQKVPFQKSSYTQYYKRWKRYIRPYTSENGDVIYPNDDTYKKEEDLRKDFRARFKDQKPKGNRSAWQFAGPNAHYTSKYDPADVSEMISSQANIYTIDRSVSNPNVLYCGAEEAGVYKSVNKGVTWQLVTQDLYVGGIESIAINPFNENKVIFASRQKMYRSLDGGNTWSVIGNATFQGIGLQAHELLYHSTDSNLVFAATQQGFYRSTDNGTNWTQILPNIARSVAIHPTNPNIIYTLQYDAQTQIAYFYKSTDKGLTFSIRQNGWFSVPAADMGKITSYGGDLATTLANPDKVYVLLVGESTSTANLQLRGTIGIYMSNDAGDNFTHPHGQIGMPYNVNTHPNLMDFDGQTSDYNQIYYNTTLICSQLDENKLLFGGLNLWRSNDGAISYQPVGGYLGSPSSYIHPDMQELRVFKTGANTEEVWLGSDGGVDFSTDFFASHEAKNFGIYAGAFWGFGQGWSEDIMVGGRYHNGNGGFFDTYPDKKFLALGGGEAPTGYALYNGEKKTYFSDINGKILPDSLEGVVEDFTENVSPNESYWENGSSNLVFDWNYWNICYYGKDNKILKSNNAGASFSDFYEFGANASNKVLIIEQAHANPQIMYAQQAINNLIVLWRTADGGQTWAQVSQPQNKSNMVFTVGYTNPNELWIAYRNGANGQKVYHSTNAGANWTNITTSTLDGIHIIGIAHQAQTDGGVYIMIEEAAVLYRNNMLSDWQLHGNNLPIAIYGNKMIPFYKENKLRVAAWNMSIWEIDLYENSTLQADFSANYFDTYCPNDTIFFTDHSVAGSNATYQWTFQNGNPATSTAKYPKVTYSSAGSFNVTLTVTENGQSSFITKNLFVSPGGNYISNIFPVNEGFESGIFDNKWRADTEGWEITSDAGGFGNSGKSMLFNNYDIDLGGGTAEIWTAKYDFSNINTAKLKWDVAYVPYASNYQDSLEVLITTDCGATYTSLYLNGGYTMATGPENGAEPFIPTASQWRTDSVLITSVPNQSEVVFVFRDIGNWGQRLYVDNINLTPLSVIGIAPSLAENQVKLFPNPNQGNFTLELTDLQGNTTITLTNSLGQVIERKQVEASKQAIFTYQLKNESKGIYFLKVANQKGTLVRKVVIE